MDKAPGLGLAWEGPPPIAHPNSCSDLAGKPEGGHRLWEGEEAHCQSSRWGLLHPVPQSAQCHHAPGGQGTSWPELRPHCPRLDTQLPWLTAKRACAGVPPQASTLGPPLVSSRQAGNGSGRQGRGSERGVVGSGHSGTSLGIEQPGQLQGHRGSDCPPPCPEEEASFSGGWGTLKHSLHCVHLLHPCVHTHIYAGTLMQTCTHVHAHSPIHKQVHMCTHAQTHAHMYRHAPTQAHAQTQAKQTHPHTSTQVRAAPRLCCAARCLWVSSEGSPTVAPRLLCPGGMLWQNESRFVLKKVILSHRFVQTNWELGFSTLSVTGTLKLWMANVPQSNCVLQRGPLALSHQEGWAASGWQGGLWEAWGCPWKQTPLQGT